MARPQRLRSLSASMCLGRGRHLWGCNCTLLNSKHKRRLARGIFGNCHCSPVKETSTFGFARDLTALQNSATAEAGLVAEVSARLRDSPHKLLPPSPGLLLQVCSGPHTLRPGVIPVETTLLFFLTVQLGQSTGLLF